MHICASVLSLPTVLPIFPRCYFVAQPTKGTPSRLAFRFSLSGAVARESAPTSDAFESAENERSIRHESEHCTEHNIVYAN